MSPICHWVSRFKYVLPKEVCPMSLSKTRVGGGWPGISQKYVRVVYFEGRHSFSDHSLFVTGSDRMDELKVFVGLRGAENVFYYGYKYTKRRSRASQFVTWRCSHYRKYSCNGTVTTSLPPVSFILYLFIN